MFYKNIHKVLRQKARVIYEHNISSPKILSKQAAERWQQLNINDVNDLKNKVADSKNSHLHFYFTKFTKNYFIKIFTKF